jgi:hypothetical protein
VSSPVDEEDDNCETAGKVGVAENRLDMLLFDILKDSEHSLRRKCRGITQSSGKKSRPSPARCSDGNRDARKGSTGECVGTTMCSNLVLWCGPVSGRCIVAQPPAEHHWPGVMRHTALLRYHRGLPSNTDPKVAEYFCPKRQEMFHPLHIRVDYTLPMLYLSDTGFVAQTES